MKNLRIVVVLLLLIESAWPVSGSKDGNCNDVSYGILKNVFNCTVDGYHREGICGLPQRIPGNVGLKGSRHLSKQ